MIWEKLKVPPTRMIPVFKKYFEENPAPFFVIATKSMGKRFEIKIPKKSPIIGAPTKCCTPPKKVAATPAIKHTARPINMKKPPNHKRKKAKSTM
jgi:hypothetical protein